MLGREADEDGLLYYMKALSQGFGKDSVLISLMNSDEARRSAGENQPSVGSAGSNVLSRELAQLREQHNKSRLHRFFRGRKYSISQKELNALEFRLESVFSSMLSQVKSEILQEITHRSNLYHEISKPAHNNLPTVNALQAQRRSVSRPGSEG